MLQVLLVTFPFFALVLAGFIAARRRMLPLEAIPGLNGFVLGPTIAAMFIAVWHIYGVTRSGALA